MQFGMDVMPQCHQFSSGAGHTEAQIQCLQGRLRALEEERVKIDGLKRELPLCIQLLHKAIETSKEQLADCLSPLGRWSFRSSKEEDSAHKSRQAHVSEDIIPVLKPTVTPSKCIGEAEKSETQAHNILDNPHQIKERPIWNTQPEHFSHIHEQCHSHVSVQKSSPPPASEQAFISSCKLFFHSNQKFGGAFVPFSRDKPFGQVVSNASARESGKNVENGEDVPPSICGNLESFHIPTKVDHPKSPIVLAAAEGSNTGQQPRKTRRCWSPELHRLFLHALQQLGGSQVATPKQIRDLMKVEGLTSDEVKSHLQKYRLHTKRPNLSHNMLQLISQYASSTSAWNGGA